MSKKSNHIMLWLLFFTIYQGTGALRFCSDQLLMSTPDHQETAHRMMTAYPAGFATAGPPAENGCPIAVFGWDRA